MWPFDYWFKMYNDYKFNSSVYNTINLICTNFPTLGKNIYYFYCKQKVLSQISMRFVYDNFYCLWCINYHLKSESIFYDSSMILPLSTSWHRFSHFISLWITLSLLYRFFACSINLQKHHLWKISLTLTSN